MYFMAKQILPELNEVEKETMQKMLSSKAFKHAQTVRIQLVLDRAQRKSTSEVADRLHIHPDSVSQIVHRFNALGIAGLLKQQNHTPGLAPVLQKMERGDSSDRAAGETQRGDTLVDTLCCETDWAQPYEGTPDPAEIRIEAARGEAVSEKNRSAVQGEAGKYRWIITEFAGEHDSF